MANRSELISDLSSVLNRHCVDNDHNTPDFILAEYLVDCLAARWQSQVANETWHSGPIPKIRDRTASEISTTKRGASAPGED